MKRFFKPVERDDSSKKPNVSASSPFSSVNNGEETAETSTENGSKKEPLKFLTWNANSFLLRVKNNWPEFSKFVEHLDPDIIAIQEVRMPAAGSKGTPKNPTELKDDTSSSREEKKETDVVLVVTGDSSVMMRALSSPPFKDYNIWWSLSDSKYGGTALLIKKCFKPQKVSFSLGRTGTKHEPDGRVILAEFESFRLLNTYVPNNGWKDEENSFQRRRKWDKRMLEFVLQNSDKALIWCGDLNVSHEEIDVSHPEFFSAAKLNGYVPPNKEEFDQILVQDAGQPGFSLSERKRFGAILKEGKLVDAYRFLHKEKDMERGFSWSGNPVGKYRGKRMRIDYFIVSEKLKDRILLCEMHGQGIELDGFFGSDHCPVSLELSADSHEFEK